MKLKELYESGKDIKESDIPKEWQESFLKFMFGSTCYIQDDEFVYYSHDFRKWYHRNQREIERDDKINSIIK
jgi:hypothetical protein